MKMQFEIHGGRIAVDAEDGFLADLVNEGLTAFRCADFIVPWLSISLSTEYRLPQIDSCCAPRWREFNLSKGRINLLLRTLEDEANDRLLIDFSGLATALISYRGPRIDIVVHDLDWFRTHYDPLYTSSVLFKSLILEALPLAGIFPLHAGMCAFEKAGIIIAGEPLMGKTSLLLALCRTGASLLADELGLLSDGSTGPELLAFPIRCKLHRHDGPIWNWLADLPASARVSDSEADLAVFDPYAAGLTVGERAQARLLLEMCDCGTAGSIEPIDEIETAVALTMYNVFYGERHTSAHFDYAASLASKLQGYRVVLGRDPIRVAKEILDLAHGRS